jgi:hypothetical protein
LKHNEDFLRAVVHIQDSPLDTVCLVIEVMKHVVDTFSMNIAFVDHEILRSASEDDLILERSGAGDRCCSLPSGTFELQWEELREGLYSSNVQVDCWRKAI